MGGFDQIIEVIMKMQKESRGTGGLVGGCDPRIEVI